MSLVQTAAAARKLLQTSPTNLRTLATSSPFLSPPRSEKQSPLSRNRKAINNLPTFDLNSAREPSPNNNYIKTSSFSTLTSNKNKKNNKYNDYNHIQRRNFHVSTRDESAIRRTEATQNMAIIGGLAVVAVTAQMGKYAVTAYSEYKNRPIEEEVPNNDGESDPSASSTSDAPKRGFNSNKGAKKVNFFDQFGFTGPSKFYEGPFDDSMSRREAALILGVREGASAKRIKEAHRNILILNHPDTGGSTFLASKINEAKELLLKGKKD